MVKAVVACGGGIATSTYVEQEILEIARKNGIDCKVTKSMLINLPAIGKEYDVCFTSSRYNEDIGIPIYSVTGVITGIREDETREEILKALRDADEKNKNKN